MKSLLAERLLAWYEQNGRSLPWRGMADPYAVWVSEVMLQQTRVETVISYFKRWMERFPTIRDLADASQLEVLAKWEGLGYYSRARNLHQAAQIVVAEYNGNLPPDVSTLKKLPGIGRYTAGAIASIAFGLDEATLDGNIRRVLARYFNITEDARSPAGNKRLWEYAAAYLPVGRAGDYNQALMDLGASVCKPRAPGCAICPLAETCQAKALGVQEQRPVLKPKARIPHYTVTAAVLLLGDNVLIAQRPMDGLLGGLWEFPGGKLQPGEDLASCLQREIREELGVDIRVGDKLGIYHHAYTHFKVTLHAFACRLANGAVLKPLKVADIRWVSLDDLSEYPMGKIDRQIATQISQTTPEPTYIRNQ